jgi:hypothetical protein
MKISVKKHLFALGLAALAAGLLLSPRAGRGQAPWFGGPPAGSPVPTNANSQRNALNNVRSRVDWLQNATRNASGYVGTGAQMLGQQFETLRGSFSAFTMTLTPQQAASGANELAELGAGLDIIAEAFNNYQDDLASGRNPSVALNDLCQVLRDATSAWLQELNKDAARLRVGW